MDMKIFTEIIVFTVKEERRTRGHGVTLAKKQCRLDIRIIFIFTKNSKRMEQIIS